ncbi:MAG: LCP family protein, partial [Lachnospira sp.]|nr:LCP family protein [Lachnospira sp.]
MSDFIKKLDIKNNKIKYIIGAIVFVLQCVATGVTVDYFRRLNVLPAKYFGLIVGVLAVLLLITLLLNLTKKKVHIFGKVFGVLVCAGLFCVCFYAHHALSMLTEITDEHYDVDIYALSVLQESSIKHITDMPGKKVGVIDTMNNKTMVDDALAQVKKAAGAENILYKSYANIAALLEGINSKEVDAILYSKNLTESFDEVIEGFTETIRDIAEYEVKVVVSDVIQIPTEAETEGDSEKETESTAPLWTDNIKVPVYNPAHDPNAAAGGGYIGGDNTRDNSSKGPITNRTFNVYISGQDAYGKVSGRSRSDVNIIMTVNPMTKEILLTNTPRDYYVPIPGVTPSNIRDKLTHAGQFGVWTSVATLENVYEIRIDYYVKVNFTSFVQIVDALGGVQVESPANFTTVNGYKFEKGTVSIATGARALAFARERKAFATGDHQRGKNQMSLINGIINKAMSPALLTNFADIVNSVKASVQTNMTMDEITSLVKMQLDNPSSWKITNQAVTGAGGQRYCYSLGSYNSTVLPNQPSINSCKAKINALLG